MKPQGAYLIHSSDRHEIERHRRENLVRSESFTALSTAVAWNGSDEQGKVLGVYESRHGLVASLRVEMVLSPEELVPKLDYEFLAVPYPCALLGKATTSAGFRGRGFNTYLRYLAYGEIYRSGLECVVGTIVPGAPRMRLMQKLGYEFVENPLGWRRFGYQSNGPTLVGVLEIRKNYGRIMGALEPLVHEHKELFPYYG
jgi:hypothetical protein